MLVLKSKLERHPYTKLHPLFASQKPRCGLVLRPRAPLIAFILANSHGDFLRGKIRGGGTKQPAPPYQRPAASPPQKGGHHCCCCLNPPNSLFPWPSTPQRPQGALRLTTGTGELEHSGISSLTPLQGQDTRSNARCGHFGPALCRLQLLQ